jgi:VWFA-related protein
MRRRAIIWRFVCAVVIGAVAPAATGQVVSDLVVRDRHGRPVQDLRPDQVEIVDGGAPAKVTSLQHGGGSDEVPLVSIVFDLAGAPAGPVQSTLLDLVTSLTSNGAFISVWKITDRLELVQPFSRDQAAVKRAIEALTAAAGQAPGGVQAAVPAGPAAAAAAPLPLEARLALDAQATVERWQRIERDEPSRTSITALLALARQQRAFKGRKALVYVCDPRQIAELEPDRIPSVIGEANSAGLSFYGLDAIRLADTGAKKPGPIEPQVQSEGQLVLISLQPQATEISPLRELAEGTGGLNVSRLKDLPSFGRRLNEDLTSYYEVKWTSDVRQADGGFRPVRVKIKRPQTRVWSRAGYFAMPEIAGMDVAPFEVPMLDALNAAAKTETIPFRAQVMEFGAASAKVAAALVVEVPLEKISCAGEPESGLCDSRFAVLAALKGADGKLIGKYSQDVSRPGETDLSRKGVFTFQRHFLVAPGEYRIEAVIYDAKAAKTSWKTIPFTVTADPGLSLSDVALVRGLNSTLLADPGDPLLFQGRQVVPLLSRQWDRGGDLPVFLSIHPDARIDKTPKVELELRRSGAQPSKPPAPLPDYRPGAPVSMVVYLKRAQLTPGPYELVATVKQGKASVQGKLEFEVLQPPEGQEDADVEDAASGPLSFADSDPKLIEGAPKPSEEDLQRILATARERAKEYRSGLPNFVCRRLSNSFSKKVGHRGGWSPLRSLVQDLQYVGGAEQVDTIREIKANDSEQMLSLNGEFGAILRLVLGQDAQAEIEWKGEAKIGGARVHVFEYHVSRKNSAYMLSVPGAFSSYTAAAYRGLVYLDAATLGVRRVSLEAEGLAPEFPIQESILAVDYDYVQIAGQRHLLPQHARLEIRQGSRLKKIDRTYRSYRMFRGESDTKYSDAVRN